MAAGLLPARFLAMGASNTFKPRLTINSIPNPATAAAQASLRYRLLPVAACSGCYKLL